MDLKKKKMKQEPLKKYFTKTCNGYEINLKSVSPWFKF